MHWGDQADKLKARPVCNVNMKRFIFLNAFISIGKLISDFRMFRLKLIGRKFV